MVCLVCKNCGVHGLICMVCNSQLCCEILMLLNMADIVFFVEGCGVVTSQFIYYRFIYSSFVYTVVSSTQHFYVDLLLFAALLLNFDLPRFCMPFEVLGIFLQGLTTSYDVQIRKTNFLLFLEAFLCGTWCISQHVKFHIKGYDLLLQIKAKTLSRQNNSRRNRSR